MLCELPKLFWDSFIGQALFVGSPLCWDLGSLGSEMFCFHFLGIRLSDHGKKLRAEMGCENWDQQPPHQCLHVLDLETWLRPVGGRTGESGLLYSSALSLFCNYLQADSIVKRLERGFHMALENQTAINMLITTIRIYH